MFYWTKSVKYIKLLKIQGTGCGDINVTFISFPKDGFLEFVKFEFHQFFSFSCIWRKVGKVFGKKTVTFRHNIALKVNSFVFHYIWQLWPIAYKNYSNICTRKCKKQYYVYCDYNDMPMIYISSDITLLRVRNH